MPAQGDARPEGSDSGLLTSSVHETGPGLRCVGSLQAIEGQLAHLDPAPSFGSPADGRSAPILLPLHSVNHTLRSEPKAMPSGWLLAVGMGYSVTVPPVVMPWGTETRSLGLSSLVVDGLPDW